MAIHSNTTRPSLDDRATELVLLLDQSGSMSDRRQETIEAVNGFLCEQRGVTDEHTFVSIYKFNSVFETWFEALPAHRVHQVTPEDYVPQCMTALYDAIGEVVERTEFRTNCCEDDPRVVLVIMTDGCENCSRRYRHRAVRRLLDRVQERGWELIFLGADVRAMRQAADLGVREDRSIRFSLAEGKVRDTMDVVSSKLAMYAQSKNLDDLDFNERDRRTVGDD